MYVAPACMFFWDSGHLAVAQHDQVMLPRWRSGRWWAQVLKIVETEEWHDPSCQVAPHYIITMTRLQLTFVVDYPRGESFQPWDAVGDHPISSESGSLRFLKSLMGLLSSLRKLACPSPPPPGRPGFNPPLWSPLDPSTLLGCCPYLPPDPSILLRWPPVPAPGPWVVIISIIHFSISSSAFASPSSGDFGAGTGFYSTSLSLPS